MTYNVFSGTLNPAQSVNQFRDITTYTVYVTACDLVGFLSFNSTVK